jgi:hemerythrin-like domain-containing protein
MKATDILKQEHRVIEQVLDCLERIADRARAAEGFDRDNASDVLEFLRVFADRCHHGKEEDRLFPAMIEKGIPREVGPVAVMLNEHDVGREAIRGMQGAVDGDDPSTFARHADEYVSLLREHIQKEDAILFPMADSVLSAEQEALSAEFERFQAEDLGTELHAQLIASADRLAEVYTVTHASERAPTPFGGSCAHH